MPRELIHWAVVDEATQQIRDRAPSLYRALEEHLAFHRLGSVAHDAPYYLRSGSSEFVATARLLHGNNGEDTLEPLRIFAGQLENLGGEERVRLAVFLAGMASHVATDASFHPFVYYFSGNYYDLDSDKRKHARARHRLLEVYLDSWCKSAHPVGGSRRLKTHYDRIAMSDSALLARTLSAICRAANLPTDEKIASAEDCWVQSLSWLVLSQRLFVSAPCGLGMRAAKMAFPRALLEIDSLFAFGRKADEFFGGQTFEFRNPVTGIQQRATLEALFERAVRDTAEMLLELEQLACGHASAHRLWSGKTGPSLSFGIAGGKNKDATYFAERGLPLKGLE